MQKLQLQGTSFPRPHTEAIPLDYTGVTSDPPYPLTALSGNEYTSASVYGSVLATTSAAHQTPEVPGIRGTDSWLDNTDKKILDPDLPLLFKLHEIWSVDS